MTFKPELFVQEGDQRCAPHNLKPCVPVPCPAFTYPAHSADCELETVWDEETGEWKACPCEQAL